MIRPALQKDIEKISASYNELLEYEEIHGTNSNWKKSLYPTLTTAEKAFNEKTLFVLEENNQICASMILNHQQALEYSNITWADNCNEEQVLVIHTLCVPPSKSGNGYGKKMVLFAIEHARKLGCRTIRIDTWKNNLPAQALYKKCGFMLMGQQHVMHMGLIDEILVYLEFVL